MKKKKNLLFIISVSLVSLLVLSLLYFGLTFFIILSPKNTFNKLFNNVFDMTSKLVAKASIEETKTSINKGNIIIDTNIEKYSNLTDYEIEYDIEIDRNKNNSLTSLKLGDDEENLDSTFYFEQNYLYVDFPYIISTLIKIPLNEFGYNTDSTNKYNYQKEDAMYLSSLIKKSFMDSIDTDKFNNSIEDGLIKSTYRIDNIELSHIIENIIKTIKDDNKAMSIIKNEKKLDNLKNKIKKELSKLEFIEINVFNNFLFKLEHITINTRNNNVELIVGDTNRLVVKTNDKEILNTSFNKSMIKSTINRKSKVIESDIKIDTSRDEINLDGFINYKSSKDEYIKLDVSLSTLLNEDINVLDSSQAKSFNQFTSKDLKSVYKIIDIVNGYIELLSGTNKYNINLKK